MAPLENIDKIVTKKELGVREKSIVLNYGNTFFVDASLTNECCS